MDPREAEGGPAGPGIHGIPQYWITGGKKNALRVIEALGPDYQIAALSAHSNVQLLAEQTRCFKPGFVAVTNTDYVKQLRGLIGDGANLQNADGSFPHGL